MDVGIIGFAGSGKTTLFNALTGAEAQTGAFHGRAAEPNVAVVKAPDPRVERLVEVFQPKKIVHAAITYIDVAGIEAREGAGAASSLDDSLINAVANCDALLAVVRGFEQAGLKPDIEAEARALQDELVLNDLARVETRIERIAKNIGRLAGAERQRLEAERDAMERCRRILGQEQPIRALELRPEEEKILRSFQFLTLKPLILVVNLGEDAIGEAPAWERRFEEMDLPPSTAAAACCAQSEMEISRIEDEAERREFLDSFGIAEPSADRIIRVSYATLGLITFFTAGPKEVHAWTLCRGLNAQQAAGVIHSDLERGFIRADIIGCEELARAGNMAEARRQGLVRTEGKNYVMQDGDVMEVKFSV